MSSLACRQCGEPITFDNKHISQRTGRKIPLDVATNEPHDCPVRREQQQSEQQPQQKRYPQCNKGCGQEIYFNANSKSQSGKWIPLDKDTGLPHQCQ
jgi:signal recognition particle subunit SEC65